MSYLIYSGPSALDGKTIFAALTGIEIPSANVKTGPILHTWILREEIPPVDAVRSGEDESICGNCSLRGNGTKGRSCYVPVFRSPTVIYKNRDKLKPITDKHLFRNRYVRLGAYGDHAALPTEITMDIHRKATGTTGYTHQWRTCDQELRKVLMASCDSVEDRLLAKEMGWNTFRIRRPGDAKLKGEELCPASEEAGKKLICHSCQKCGGNKTNKDIVINVHGIGRLNFNRREV